MSTVLYFIHRVREPSVEVNKARAYRWLRWLKHIMPDVVICAPWLPYVEALDDRLVEERNMGMRDGAILAGLVGINCGIVCGPEISGGCAADIQNLRDHGHPTISLTRLGFAEPPPEQGFADLERRLQLLVGRLPLLEDKLWFIDYDEKLTFRNTTHDQDF